MDWSKVVQKAIAVAGSTSEMTFEELDALIAMKNVSNRDLEDLLNALQENGIRVVER